MLYAIMARDVASSSSQRAATRPRHLEYVSTLLRNGRLVFAGPHPAIDSPDPGPAGFSGSLVIAEFESLEAAEHWAANDPYRVEGVFAEVEIKPVLRALP
jgi:uncharacterized protein YciI